MKNSSTLLLAVVIILAVAHVARSQGTEGPPPEPTVVGGSVDSFGIRFYRFWSDGSVDFSRTIGTPGCVTGSTLVCVGIPILPATSHADVIQLPTHREK